MTQAAAQGDSVNLQPGGPRAGGAPRVAIVSTHAIQYHAPWFRALARRSDLETVVLYCHEASAREQSRAGFGVEFQWDVSLLDGYRWERLKNVAPEPGIHFRGLDTPELGVRIGRGEFDAVVLNGWHYKSAWQGLYACWKAGVAVMAHSDSHLKTPRPALKLAAKWPFYRLFIGRLDACLPVGRWSREYFLHYGARPERVFEVPHIVDLERIAGAADAWSGKRGELRQKWELAADETVFLFAGKFIEEKRPLDFVRAIGRARRAGLRIAGLMAGDGPLRAACGEAAAAEGADIRFTGFLNQSEIIQAYAAADALVLPSVWETWGMVVNEAMACGRPCFTSDQVGCSPDLIETGRTGATFACGRVDELEALLGQYADRGRLQEMGLHARQASSRYSPEAAAAQLAGAVQKTLARKQCNRK